MPAVAEEGVSFAEVCWLHQGWEILEHEAESALRSVCEVILHEPAGRDRRESRRCARVDNMCGHCPLNRAPPSNERRNDRCLA
eukprot:4799372-Prymnesium_polylepis.1